MELTYPCQCIVVSPLGLKLQKIDCQGVNLFMQQLDGMKCGMGAITLHAICIQPYAKVTMMVIQRRWGFLLSPDVVFY